jgi:FixJ family two-component response regulator
MGHSVAVTTSHPTSVVYVVDDDVSVREALELLIETAGWRVEAFESAEAFLARARVNAPSCVVLDYSLPRLNGLELQQRIAAERSDMPIIFLTGHADVPMSVQAMKAGAVELLTKPFSDDVLLVAIEQALQRSEAALHRDAEMRDVRARYESLSRRERDVMELVVVGLLNKQVADRLGISEITVKAHRGRMMRKMRVRSVADLVKMTQRILPT